MKKLAVSVGVVALGATTMHRAFAAGLGVGPEAKPWSVSATLRGFYDDNVLTTSANKVDSFGFEVNPTIGVSMVGEQTTMGASYSYSGRWYDKNQSTQLGLGHWNHQ